MGQNRTGLVALVHGRTRNKGREEKGGPNLEANTPGPVEPSTHDLCSTVLLLFISRLCNFRASTKQCSLLGGRLALASLAVGGRKSTVPTGGGGDNEATTSGVQSSSVDATPGIPEGIFSGQTMRSRETVSLYPRAQGRIGSRTHSRAVAMGKWVTGCTSRVQKTIELVKDVDQIETCSALPFVTEGLFPSPGTPQQ
ncbi:uncharacterized protein ColSpa_01856 [Colletotrichum spaethianum]|uniref:Uncharacterized protein n=1 Tax=Colletotrichum spaethianum TaxID=700344 RepID=A0AA37NWU3_9PEZI|nr:uncharacterized protein ColSpa_01856 [Colletotrichum spaethianum]GKT41675.1 hypothetical protein ColSpa_01856 [Colletotrichum spaethianum]